MDSKKENEADKRDDVANIRDEAADKRDEAADERDTVANKRDHMAEARDARAFEVDTYANALVDVIIQRESFVKDSIRALKWLVSILIIISVGNFTRSFINQDATDKATAAAHVAEEASIRAANVSIESRNASVDTLNELRAIIAEIRESRSDEPGLQNQAIIDALQAIARIEGFLCGGPCTVEG